MDKNIIELHGGVVRDSSRRFAEVVNFELAAGEQMALMALNGGGKTILLDIIQGKLYLAEGKVRYDFGGSDGHSAYRNISHITFRDAYGSADSGYYYQQRWNSTDREETPMVGELLSKVECENKLRDELFSLLNITPLLDRPVITLSSGELRRFHIARALLTAPKVLILENPFIGLDMSTRALLTGLLQDVIEKTGLQLILVVASPEDIPPFVTHVYTLDNMCLGPKQSLGEFRRTETFTAQRDRLGELYSIAPVELPPATTSPPCYRESVSLKDIHISYGQRKLFDGLDWAIEKGEKWTLTGPNGSGKSTLLSLITADNPQAYAQDITLFGRRRGTGESIWDIKKRIGYVSPEMHRSYIKDIPAVDIVASGFFDSIGLYHTAADSQREVCRQWMRALEIEHLAGRSFLKLSSGEQRLLLLARAFVKDPDLLILDEPLHGLDLLNKERARAVIGAFCRREGKTLIYVTHYQSEVPSAVTRRMEL